MIDMQRNYVETVIESICFIDDTNTAIILKHPNGTRYEINIQQIRSFYGTDLMPHNVVEAVEILNNSNDISDYKEDIEQLICGGQDRELFEDILTLTLKKITLAQSLGHALFMPILPKRRNH